MDLQSVVGVIFSPDRSQVLLIQRRDVPVWTLPGGGIDPGESPEEALLREIVEETGFHVKIKRTVGIYLPINRLAKKTALFECEITYREELDLSKETRALRFFPLTHLPKRIPPPYLEWIEEGKQENPPVTRELKSVNYKTLLKHTLLHPILVLRFLLARIKLPINS